MKKDENILLLLFCKSAEGTVNVQIEQKQYEEECEKRVNATLQNIFERTEKSTGRGSVQVSELQC